MPEQRGPHRVVLQVPGVGPLEVVDGVLLQLVDRPRTPPHGAPRPVPRERVPRSQPPVPVHPARRGRRRQVADVAVEPAGGVRERKAQRGLIAPLPLRLHDGEVGQRLHGFAELRGRAGQARRLLSGDVERPAAGLSPLGSHGQQQRRFSDAGLAGQQHRHPRDQPAAQHAIQLTDPGQLSVGGLGRDLRDRHCPGGRRNTGLLRRSGPALFGHTTPGLALTAPANPLRRGPTALGAAIRVLFACHAPQPNHARRHFRRPAAGCLRYGRWCRRSCGQ